MKMEMVLIEKSLSSHNIILDVCSLMLSLKDKKELNRNIVVERTNWGDTHTTNRRSPSEPFATIMSLEIKPKKPLLYCRQCRRYRAPRSFMPLGGIARKPQTLYKVCRICREGARQAKLRRMRGASPEEILRDKLVQEQLAKTLVVRALREGPQTWETLKVKTRLRNDELGVALSILLDGKEIKICRTDLSDRVYALLSSW